MLLDCDKIISGMPNGDKIGVYEMGTDGREIFFECEPVLARKLVELWNKFRDYIDGGRLPSQKSFIVSSICREDLKNYLSEKQIKRLEDSDLDYIAKKLGNALQDLYWISLEVIINDSSYRLKPKLKGNDK